MPSSKGQMNWTCFRFDLIWPGMTWFALGSVLCEGYIFSYFWVNVLTNIPSVFNETNLQIDFLITFADISRNKVKILEKYCIKVYKWCILSVWQICYENQMGTFRMGCL